MITRPLFGAGFPDLENVLAELKNRPARGSGEDPAAG